jgi:hypothetical protein
MSKKGAAFTLGMVVTVLAIMGLCVVVAIFAITGSY